MTINHATRSCAMLDDSLALSRRMLDRRVPIDPILAAPHNMIDRMRVAPRRLGAGSITHVGGVPARVLA